ncbi:hypothetical protein CU044_3216 [Streptomyces sp. L-9-10]|nr:hypothetical protein CU044_3216 [Streptomyces sp. L-9-10]
MVRALECGGRGGTVAGGLEEAVQAPVRPSRRRSTRGVEQSHDVCPSSRRIAGLRDCGGELPNPGMSYDGRATGADLEARSCPGPANRSIQRSIKPLHQ